MKFEKLKYFQLLFKHSSWVTHSVLVAVVKKHVSQKQILTFSYFYRREIVPIGSLIRKARTLYGLPSHTQQLYSLERSCVRVRSLDLAIVLDIEF